MGKKMVTVVGARPQFVKAALVSRYVKSQKVPLHEVLVHTGQHYDTMMSDVFFKELGMAEPAYHLGVGAKSGVQQLADMVSKLEPVLLKEAPDLVLVYGDTHSTLASAVCATHLGIPLVHVEAGERIFRRAHVPEEINRILTDHVASLCLTCTNSATQYLLQEGFSKERVQFVGDLMYELYATSVACIDNHATLSLSDLDLTPLHYHVATIHRAQNTQDFSQLTILLEAMDNSALPVVLPVHPRVAALLKKHNYTPKKQLKLIDPLGYFDFMRLLQEADKVLTDSGGVTREAFFAKKMCIVPMQNTWWRDITDSGWSVNVGFDVADIVDKLDHETPPQFYPDGLFGDGKTAEKIVSHLMQFLDYPGKVAWHRHGPFEALPKSGVTNFTYDGYQEMLDAFIQAGYVFGHFGQYKLLLDDQKPFILLRHDIDMSIEKALEMAKIESKRGISATYFFMVRNDFYNVFSKDTSDCIRDILALGHTLGLHFDCTSYSDQSEAALNTACQREVAILQEWFDVPVDTVSFHRPSEAALQDPYAVSQPAFNTYQSVFFKESITYRSDSQGVWAYGAPTESEAFKEKKPMQLLVHPIWWNQNPMSPYALLQTFVLDRTNAMERDLSRHCKVYPPMDP